MKLFDNPFIQKTAMKALKSFCADNNVKAILITVAGDTVNFETFDEPVKVLTVSQVKQILEAQQTIDYGSSNADEPADQAVQA